jgi:hypothetical protein
LRIEREAKQAEREKSKKEGRVVEAKKRKKKATWHSFTHHFTPPASVLASKFRQNHLSLSLSLSLSLFLSAAHVQKETHAPTHRVKHDGVPEEGKAIKISSRV